MKKKVLAILFILLLAAAAYYYLKPKTVILGGYRGEPIEEIGNDPAIKDMPPAAVAERRQQLAELAGQLKENPNQPSLWMNVGLVKKFFNNYRGAVQAYEYAAVLAPTDPLVRYNLGNLYGAYLKDYPKAEENYLKAVDMGLNLSYTYLGLADFYINRDRRDEAEKILLDGIKSAPDDANLPLKLAVLYKEQGSNVKAIEYFQKFLNYPNVTGAEREAVLKEIAALR